MTELFSRLQLYSLLKVMRELLNGKTYFPRNLLNENHQSQVLSKLKK